MYRRCLGLSVLCGLLAACGGGGGGGASPSPNASPIASAGADIEVNKNTLVTLAGTGTDSDGTIASIAWTQTGGASVVLNGSNTYAAYFTAPNVTANTTLEFTLTLVDNRGASTTDSVRVQVQPGIWEDGVALRDSRFGLAACSLANEIYVFGGANFDTLTEKFDVTNQTWTTLATMPTARRHGHACAVVSNKIYVMGGYNDVMGGWNGLDTVEAFDPATNSWSTQTPMPTPRYGAAAAALNGKIYVLGGRNGTANTLSTVEEFDPASGTWSTKASLPIAVHSPVAAVIAGKLYAIGGYGADNTAHADSYEYDPATNAWRQLASMTTSRVGHSEIMWDGRIYVFGGESDTAGGAIASIEMYDPGTNRWSQKSDMPHAREYHASAIVADSAYLLGGRSTSQGAQPLVYEADIYNPGQDE